MALVVPDVGEPKLLTKIISDADVVYHLFQNNYTPSEATVLTDLTEANFTGYAAKTVYVLGSVNSPKWQTPLTDASGITYSEADQQLSWQNTGTTSQTIYGYYVTDTTGNDLLWVERFATPRTLGQNDTLNLTPRIELA